MVVAQTSAAELLTGSPYVGYTYSYPHKTSHRPLAPALPLDEVWKHEDQSSLFLYLHVPFCEMRCGFCNLFTTTRVEPQQVDQYLAALRRQAEVVSARMPSSGFARVAIGGGTPTFLQPKQLEHLLCSAGQLGVDARAVPISVETSPKTATRDRLSVLRAAGVQRVSIGVQSFDDAEAHALGRPQQRREVDAALQAIRDCDFEVLNIDLMYGGQGQSTDSWLSCLEHALRWRPEELYLYPLYVRQLTGLAKLGRQWDDERLDAYRHGRDYLLAKGYQQVSMRMFRHGNVTESRAPAYRCQDDGMVGLGCGARSYTRDLHYSWPYAVGHEGIRQVIANYGECSDEFFGAANYGVRLSQQEQLRRYVLLSLLLSDGLDCEQYRQQFHRNVRADFPGLGALEELSLAETRGRTIKLTSTGMERSDAIGPWLYSAEVKSQMKSFQWS